MTETKRKAARNDALRAKIPYIPPPDGLVVTCGVASLSRGEVADILQRVREFNAFTPDNDPWSEHDFGSFSYDGRKIFWKIDDYDRQEGSQLVLTVMFADEY